MEFVAFGEFGFSRDETEETEKVEDDGNGDEEDGRGRMG